ncbi:MAG TPA: hypothetical protein VKG23_11810 [Thermoanaerobaculia bacterium]|nr:hypothetical protein [Thermoanaerobaculia bacterium]
MTRRGIAGGAAGVLLALILLGQSWAEIPRRIRFLSAFASKELAVRRLGGSGTAFDRRYFSFLENARRRIPRSAKGIVMLNAPANEPLTYLTMYQFAPLPVSFGPVRVGLEPSVPSGWFVAEYGGGPAPGRDLLPEGTVWGPAP